MKKEENFGRLVSGILMCITAFGVIFLLVRWLGVYQLRTLKWLPVLMTCVGFYLSGLVNQKTKLSLLSLLLVGLLAFTPLGFFYFPFVFVLILCAVLALLLSRKEISAKIRLLLFVPMFGIFAYFLFSQPLIIRKKGFSIDEMGNLHSVKVLWDFREPSSEKIPEYVFKDVSGNNVQLTDFKGKTIYVTFWATWCNPCMAEKPKLEEIKKIFENNENLIFVDISLDSKRSSWEKYVSEKNPAGIQLNSTDDRQVRETFQIAGIPHNIIISPKGYYKKISRPSSLGESHFELFVNQDAVEKYVIAPIMYFEK